VTGCAGDAESETVNAALAMPLLPSLTLAALTESTG
jgi:hypothetical protein